MMKVYPINRVMLMAAASLFVAGMSASAQTGFIDSSGDHLWTNSVNWDNGLPVSSSAVEQTSNDGTQLILDSTASIASLNNGNNSTSSFTIASGGALSTSGRFEIGNSGSLGVGILQVDGGSLNVGGDLHFARFGANRKGIAVLDAGNITVDGITYLGGWNPGTGALTINGGAFTANNNIYVGLSGAGSLTVNGGDLFVTNSLKALKISPNAGNGRVVINGGTVTVDALEMDGNVDGTARIEVNGGLLKINRPGGGGLDIANDDARFFIGNGTVVQTGETLATIVDDAVSGGYITWSGTTTNMLTENWDVFYKNETDSILYVDYNDVYPGSTTVWASRTDQTGGAGENRNDESTLVSSDGVMVYTNVPGLAPSEFYSFRVRAVGSTNWLSPFAWITRCIPDSQENRDNTHYYCRYLGDWSNTYINFELSNNIPVEIEISKVGGAPITNAVPHPRRKVKSWRVENGKAYMVIDQPVLFAIDIDGQMDSQATARTVAGGWTDDYFYDGPPIHTVTIFANPVIDKPDINDPSVYVVEPGEIPPELGAWSTLYFKPGVHQLFAGDRLDTYYDGCDFQLKSGKNYYVPGDAIVYGHMNAADNSQADIMTANTRVYGYGTLSGARSTHPEEMTTFIDHMSPEGLRMKAISIQYASGCMIEGITMTDSAMHSGGIGTRWQQYSNTADINYIKWAKTLTWRGNGDGFSVSGNGYLENCFLRTQDDGTYLNGLGVSNMVYWSDVNGAVFRCDNITSKKGANYPEWLPDTYYIQDIDIIYARCVFGPRSAISRKGGTDGALLANGETNTAQHLVFRNINLEDSFPNRKLLDLLSSESDGCEGDLAGIRFENVRGSFPQMPEGATNTLSGYETVESRTHIHDLLFDNLVIAGEQIDHLDDFDHNEYAYDMIFSNTAPEIMHFLNTSGYGKWYVYGDWDGGVEPASHDIAMHTLVPDTLKIDAPAYAGSLVVSHADTAMVNIDIPFDGVFSVNSNLTLGTGAGGSGQLDINGGSLWIGNICQVGDDSSLNLKDGQLWIKNDDSGALLMDTNASLQIGSGFLYWKGNRISDLDGLISAGCIVASSDPTNMLFESWDASWTNGGKTLFADYNDVSNGYTTVWAYEYGTDITPPTAPAQLAAIGGPGQISLAWDAGTDSDLSASPYTLYRSATSGSGYSVLATNLADTAYTDSNVVAGETWYYVLTAKDVSGNESAFSAEVSATVQSLPSVATVDMIGNTTGDPGGEFADYSGLASGNAIADWPDSVVIDGVVSLSVGGPENTDSKATFNTSTYKGTGTEIAFAKNAAHTTVTQAIAGKIFLSIRLDSTGFNSDEFTFDSIALSLWRNGSGAATHYQLAYDADGDGYDTGDLLGSPVEYNLFAKANTFVVSNTLPEVSSTRQEVRLYYWGGVWAGNTHLFEVGATYTLAAGNRFALWAEQFGGTNVIGSATEDYDYDGQPNLAEYALNGNPTNAAETGLNEFALNGTTFTMVYASNAVDGSLTYRLLGRTNLLTGVVQTNNWNSQSFGPAVGGYATVSNHYGISIEQLFIELEVEQQ